MTWIILSLSYSPVFSPSYHLLTSLFSPFDVFFVLCGFSTLFGIRSLSIALRQHTLFSLVLPKVRPPSHSACSLTLLCTLQCCTLLVLACAHKHTLFSLVLPKAFELGHCDRGSDSFALLSVVSRAKTLPLRPPFPRAPRHSLPRRAATQSPRPPAAAALCRPP